MGRARKQAGPPAVAAASTPSSSTCPAEEADDAQKGLWTTKTPARDREFCLLSHHVSHTEIGKKKRNAPDVAGPVLSGLMSRSDTGRRFVVL